MLWCITFQQLMIHNPDSKQKGTLVHLTSLDVDIKSRMSVYLQIIVSQFEHEMYRLHTVSYWVQEEKPFFFAVGVVLLSLPVKSSVCVCVCESDTHYSLLHVRVRFNCDQCTPHIEQRTTGARHLKGDKLTVIHSLITNESNCHIPNLLMEDSALERMWCFQYI